MSFHLKPILCGAALTGILLTASDAQAQSCADLAAPIQTKDVGVWFEELDAERAKEVCAAELAANPDDHSVIAHMIRVMSKLEDQEAMARLIPLLDGTDNPDALAYLGVLSENETKGTDDRTDAVAYYARAAEAGNLFAASNLSGILLNDKTTPHDPARGRALRQQAAEAGGILAALDYGKDLMYETNGVARDEAAAVEFFRVAADGRDKQSMAELGRAYRYGKGVTIDHAVALEWFEQASERGNAYSIEQLAYMYRDGLGVAKNKARAKELFQEASELGRQSASFALGILLEHENRPRESALAYREAARKGHIGAHERLGVAYYFGKGVPHDPLEGIRLTAIAADAGDVWAQQRMADFLRSGIGVPQDHAQAAALYAKAAEKDLAHAVYELALLHINGQGVEKDQAKGFELLQRAAELGNNKALLSIAYAYSNGQGVETSHEQALRYYARAANASGTNHRLARSNMAELYEKGLGAEQDLEKAKALYRRAAKQDWLRAMRRLANLLIEDGTPEALDEASELYVRAAALGSTKALSRIEAAFADADDPLHANLIDPDPSLQGHYVSLGRQYEEVRVGCVILLIDCGELASQKLDLSYAATWYRRAGDNPEAQFRLGWMLTAQPHVDQRPDEARTALERAAQAGNADATLMLALSGLRAEQVGPVMSTELAAFAPAEAARLAVASVSGRFGDDAIGPGWTWLAKTADAGEPTARMGLVGAALFLGAFDLAADELDKVAEDVPLDLSEVDYTIRQALTFLMTAVRQGVTPAPERLDAMERLLGMLDARGQDSAGDLALMLEEVRYRLATRDSYEPYVPPTEMTLEAQLQQIDERIAQKNEGRGVSPLLVQLYRERARLLAEQGDLQAAEEAVYRSVAIARRINDQSRHLIGGLVYHMEMACNERKGSDLLFEIGVDAAGLALAKSAVNHLQSARSKLIGLPQELQNCFRDLLADQYRRMADLLIRNGYLDEAQAVLAQLKDFETFRYSGEAVERVGASFAPVALSDEQSAIMARIHGLPVEALIALEQRRAALEDTDTEAAAEIEAQLEEAQLALADSLDALSEAVDAMDTEASRDLAREVSSRTLRRVAGRLERLDSVAMVYSVSLPTRTHFLIVTAAGTEHHELEIGREDLHAQIEALREVLSNPAQDPARKARDFYQTVWAGVDRALTSLGEDGQVILVLDGRMRYVPVPALLGPEGWLVNGHRYVTFTPASRDLLLDDEEIEELRVEALGASRGGDGFSPLPYVREELATIVGLDSAGPAIAEGRAWLDDGFDGSALEHALSSGAPIVHVATHFDLTEDEASSRLLLGTGDTMSVASLKDGARSGALDFRDVQMLVLSACRTGFSGGSELESLATEMQYEGVRTVLATLWPVADQSTAAFMAAFYAELRAGAGRAEALHAVQRQFSNGADLAQLDANVRGAMSLFDDEDSPDTQSRLSHPFYWAGFQMIGQWR